MLHSHSQGVQRECSECRKVKAQGLLYNHLNSLPMKEVSIAFPGIQKGISLSVSL